MIIVVMGVSGSGKTTVGARLAAELGWSFYDADDFHPASNVEKMASGVPLTEADRAPWLGSLRRVLEACVADGRSAVLACSALSARSRDALRVDGDLVRFVHLVGSRELIAGRLARRRGHYMPAALLDSQFAALEPPDDAIAVDVAPSPEAIVAEIQGRLAL